MPVLAGAVQINAALVWLACATNPVGGSGEIASVMVTVKVVVAWL